MKKIDDYLDNAKTVCITGHVNPDGDCCGSVLGLYNYLTSNYKELEVDICIEQPSEKLNFLASFDKIRSDYGKGIEYDLMFCLDSATLDRIGKAVKYFESAKFTVNIDHHISDTGFADEDIIFADASSTCEILFCMFDSSRINRDTAICLYTGILYDTGVFKYSNTSPETMRIVSELLKHGIPASDIIDNSFYARTYDENRIYGYALTKGKLYHDGKTIAAYITKEEMKQFNVTSKGLDGIVSQLRLTVGVECAVFMYEKNNGDNKLSLRSDKYLDVNKIAGTFGGGGHIRASGAVLKGNIEDCLETVLFEVGKYI